MDCIVSSAAASTERYHVGWPAALGDLGLPETFSMQDGATIVIEIIEDEWDAERPVAVLFVPYDGGAAPAALTSLRASHDNDRTRVVLVSTALAEGRLW